MPGMIKKEDIEKVRATADLYDIVSATVTLKPSGTGTYVGLCPFHDEKTPSFSVRPALGVWHCFGCGLGGDVFGYVEHQENIDFRDAVELLADKYHIELHYDKADNVPAHTGSKRARLLEANEAAQEFFVSQLMTKEALAARKLLDGRNFSQADCQRFGCGYAPQGWDNLVRHLAGKGFTQQEMLDAGLARQGQRGVYDYFRGRVTWPIRDSTGRTLGFGARKLYEDDTINAKYINTPDTQLYRKNTGAVRHRPCQIGDCEETPGGDRRRLYRCDGHASGRHRHGGRHVRHRIRRRACEDHPPIDRGRFVGRRAAGWPP